jgi:hypothetical protein
VFPQASNLAAAISHNDQGYALFTVDSGNTVTFAGVSEAALKQHLSDFQIV